MGGNVKVIESNFNIIVSSYDTKLQNELSNSNVSDSLNVTTLIVGTGFFQNLSSSSLVSLLSNWFRNSEVWGEFTLIVYKAFEFRDELLKDWETALTVNALSLKVIPVSSPITKSSLSQSPSLNNAQAIALSFNPEIVIFGEFLSLSDLAGYVSFVESAVSSATATNVAAISSPNFSPASSVTSTNVKNMRYIGSCGWYNAYSNNGFNEVLYDYYESSMQINGQTYYFFVSGVQHSVQGYHELFGGWKAWKYQDITNWQTSSYAGQILQNWTQQGSGYYTFNSQNPTFTLPISFSISGLDVGISWTIYYGGTPNLNYNDQSNPGAGYVDTFYRWGIGANVGDTYTVYSLSLGELDPTKAGGFPPMDLIQESPATLQAYDDAASCHMPYNTTYVALYADGVSTW